MLPAYFNVVSIAYTILMILKSMDKNQSEPDSFKMVTTENGAVRGRLELSFLQKVPYYSFKGIPYAQPPVGELRFKVNLIQKSKYFS